MLCTIPTELLAQILRYVPKQDLQQMRLVNRHTHDVACSIVFHHTHTGFFIFSLQKLMALSRSRAAKHVKKLTFHPELLPSWTREQWEGHIDFRPPYSEWKEESEENDNEAYDKLPRHEFDTDKLDAGWKAFNARSEEQTQWREHNEGLVFRECFSSFPNLTEAIVQPSKPYISQGRLNDQPFWFSLAREILVGPDAWSYGTREDLLDGAAALSLLEAVGYRASFAGVKKTTALTLDILAPQSLLETMGCTYSVRGERDPTNHASRYNLIYDAFRELRHLVLSVPHASNTYEKGRGSQAEEMLDVLKSGRELRSLRLIYGNAERVDSTVSPETGLGPLFAEPEVLWPHLTSLKLEASIPCEPFTHFLSVHSASLKRLEVRDAVSDDWPTVFTALPKVCKLEHVYLECLWNWQFLENEDGDVEAQDDGTEIREGKYVCYFEDGTDSDTEQNGLLMKYLLRGEGELVMY